MSSFSRYFCHFKWGLKIDKMTKIYKTEIEISSPNTGVLRRG
jgi:hypothetical protein